MHLIFSIHVNQNMSACTFDFVSNNTIEGSKLREYTKEIVLKEKPLHFFDIEWLVSRHLQILPQIYFALFVSLLI